MLVLKQLNDGGRRLPDGGCGWYGVKFQWRGPSARVAALARFRSPNGTGSHNVSVFGFQDGKVLGSAWVGSKPAADVSGFVWQQLEPAAQLERGGTFVLASREGGADGFFGEASTGGCASNSDGHGGGTPWVRNRLGGNTTVLLGSVYAPCGPVLKWQNLNDGSEHAFGPVNLRLVWPTRDAES